jgi:hypothetical protein
MPHASSVLVAFDCNWERTYPLRKDGERWFLTMYFLPCVLRYKYIVDGVWMTDMEQETVTEPDGAINNIVYITENPVEKEQWMNLKSDYERLKVQLIQHRTSSPRVSDGDQSEVQNLVKLIERLKYEKQERQVMGLELQEAQNTNRKLKAEYSSVQHRYQNCQQDLQLEKQDVDKLRKEVEVLTKENLILKNEVMQFDKKQSQLAEQFDSIKLENRLFQAKLAEKSKFEEEVKRQMIKNKELTERVGLEMLKLEKQRQLLAEEKEIHRQSELAFQKAMQKQKYFFQELLEEAENQKAILTEALNQPQSQKGLREISTL